MDARAEVDRILRERGAVLSRQRKHEVWRFPDGKTFVRASTPSDWRADLNNLRDLRRVLGLVDPQRGVPGERRQRKEKHASPARKALAIGATAGGALQDQLRLVGLKEDALQQDIARLKLALTQAMEANARKRFRLRQYETRRCWWCRIQRWFRVTAARWAANRGGCMNGAGPEGS